MPPPVHRHLRPCGPRRGRFEPIGIGGLGDLGPIQPDRSLIQPPIRADSVTSDRRPTAWPGTAPNPLDLAPRAGHMIGRMSELSPSEFSAATGLSAKALRIYEERGLLAAARIDPVNGYRRYRSDQVAAASRIALLRQAGISLAEIGRFLARPSAEVIEGWLADAELEITARRRALSALAQAMGLASAARKEKDMTVVIRTVASEEELVGAFDLAGAQFDPLIDHSDVHRFAELARAYPSDLDLLQLAEEDGRIIGAALGFRDPDGENVTLRILAVEASRQGAGIGRALLRAFEAGAQRLGARRISLGADQQAGFYVRHGYQTMLLLQWAYSPESYGIEMEAVLGGPAEGMEYRQAKFQGIPQLFIDLDEPDPLIRGQIRDLASGANVGYCMTRLLRSLGQPGRDQPWSA